tara:strand:+ start:99 stop:491 length:393 start_codon:yes stop_codon:yes gene_type:complete
MSWKDTLKKEYPFDPNKGDAPNFIYQQEQYFRERKEKQEQENQKTKNMTRQERENYPLYLKAKKLLDSMPPTIKRKFGDITRQKYKKGLAQLEQLLQKFLNEGDYYFVYETEEALRFVKHSMEKNRENLQ